MPLYLGNSSESVFIAVTGRNDKPCKSILFIYADYVDYIFSKRTTGIVYMHLFPFAERKITIMISESESIFIRTIFAFQ